MARLPQINQLKQSKAAQEAMQKPVEQAITPQSVAGGFQQMGQFNPQQPVLQKMDVKADYNATRSQALGHESNLADPEKAQKFWTEQVKAHPESTYAIVNQMFASNETPEEKARRERREALGETFRGLGNLIGNAANLYYTHRGGQYIDLNTANEKHRERMQRIKDKQDALDEQRKQIILNARLGEAKQKHAEKLAEKKAKTAQEAKDKEFKQNIYLKGIDHANKMKQDEAAAKARSEEAARKHKNALELEDKKHKNNVALRGMQSGDRKADNEKVLTSLTGSDGNAYTRNTKMDNVEIRELAKYVEDWFPYTTVDENGKTTVDYIGAIADAAESGMIPTYVLEERGFKKGNSSGKKRSSLGIGIGNNKNNGNKLGIGL